MRFALLVIDHHLEHWSASLTHIQSRASRTCDAPRALVGATCRRLCRIPCAPYRRSRHASKAVRTIASPASASPASLTIAGTRSITRSGDRVLHTWGSCAYARDSDDQRSFRTSKKAKHTPVTGGQARPKDFARDPGKASEIGASARTTI